MGTPDQLYAYSRERNGRGVVVLKSGEIIAEDYSNGGSVDDAHSVRSASKSITGLSIAKLVSLGTLTFCTQVASVITEWAPDPVKSKIAVKHLLTQTAGVESIGILPRPYEECVALPIVRPLGTFAYDNASHIILGELISRVTGQHPGQWFAANVAEPAGFSMGSWTHIQLNLQQPNTASGANITARNFALLGEFMRKGGQGVISRDVIQECLTQCPAYAAYTNGSWWRTSDPMAEIIKGPVEDRDPLPADGFAAVGLGWNLLYVFPRRKMVVARIGQAPLDGQPAFIEAEFLDLAMRL